ncbi:MAG: endonuclease/exonuclease/phosphatase family protein [Saprospiraceae bacterium]
MHLAAEIFIWLLGGFGAIGSFASLLRFEDWWIRGFDFPRVQLTLFMVTALVLTPLVADWNDWMYYAFAAALLGGIGIQFFRIYPYTLIAAKQVKDAASPASESTIKLMISNVLMTNRDPTRLLALVKTHQPNLLLTLETDKWWEDKLEAGIGDRYPHIIRVPLDNLYGMHLFSNLKLIDVEVKYLIKEDIPSIHCRVELPDGDIIKLHCLHPMPPSPTEAYSSTGRDAELLMIGKKVAENNKATIVAGDLNDVAWSHSTNLFLRASGLLDPRRGRGFFNTFHAEYRLLRWPLDHIFHSDDFGLVDIRRLPKVGSDHFPVLLELHHQPETSSRGYELEHDEDGREEVEEKVREGVDNDPNLAFKPLDLDLGLGGGSGVL